MLEKHHKVRILDEAVDDAVRLSHRYITDRQLPDKSVSLLDTACARVALSQSATPPALEDVQPRDRAPRRRDRHRSSASRPAGADHAERLDGADEAQGGRRGARKRAGNAAREGDGSWSTKIRELREQAGSSTPAGKERPGLGRAALKAELAQLRRRSWPSVQGETPLVYPVVDGQAVAEVVSGLDRHPGRQDGPRRDQDGAGPEGPARASASSARTTPWRRSPSASARPGPTWPIRGGRIGVFLLVGPSGVGKTETAMALADILYGGDRNMVVINMSEYKEEHKVSQLTGSPPGYVGYGEGGVLTEAVRRKPY